VEGNLNKPVRRVLMVISAAFPVLALSGALWGDNAVTNWTIAGVAILFSGIFLGLITDKERK